MYIRYKTQVCDPVCVLSRNPVMLINFYEWKILWSDNIQLYMLQS